MRVVHQYSWYYRNDKKSSYNIFLTLQRLNLQYLTSSLDMGFEKQEFLTILGLKKRLMLN